MQSFFKKRPANPESSNSAKRPRLAGETTDPSKPVSPYPKRIACWNCNGLSARLNSPSNVKSLKSFLATEKPDVLFLSEVRLPAANNAGKSQPSSTTTWYRNRIRDSDKRSASDKALVQQLLRSPECAPYKTYFSLADTKYAGTAMLLNTNTTALPVSVRYNVQTMDVKKTVHDEQGRVIVAKFEQFSILHTYVPNNGWGGDHFIRRRKWDESILSFMRRKKEAGIRMIWIGDLNVAPADNDLSDAKYFRRQTGRNKRAKAPSGPVSAEDTGQPGCTDSERKRFAAILEEGNLQDVFRALYGEEHRNEDMTWRGAETGMLGSRGMRIDHCIASEAIVPAVQSVSVMGRAERREGFMGSDHCPLLILCQMSVIENGLAPATPTKEGKAVLESLQPATEKEERTISTPLPADEEKVFT